ncbi:MAG: transglycosylase domain-containing protein [Bacilli bacterium]|nr:transglycosylase domain-containing protein [Bacilli bacterium]
MRRKLLFILKVCRIFLAIVIILSTIVVIAFSIINYKLSYDIPKVVNIELYDNEENLVLSYTNGKKQSYVKLENISQSLIDAFISIEDKRYYDHQGVDFIRIIGAVISDLKSGSFKEGASTITQQYVRGLYLNNNKTIKRKLYELLIAINIESKYSKDEILEGYLNTIYFDHGIYGVEDASLFYFGKHASELTVSESCILASIPKGPSIYSPIKNIENNTTRKNIILKELLNDQKISEETYIEAINDTPKLIGVNKNLENENAPYFQDMVIEEINKMGFLNDYLYEGIKVYTTLDLDLNNTILKYLNQYLPNDEIEFSAYAIEPKTGKVLTVIGGTNYKESTYNRATLSKRQPGSTIKPFLYLTALENGFTQATTFISEPTTFYYNKLEYSPKNYHSIYPNQDVSMVYAIATSDNIYAMKTHLFLGPEKLSEKLTSFGLGENIPAIPSLALGTYEVTLEDLTCAYQILANSGIKHENYLIEKITTFDDVLLYEKKNSNGTRLADEADIYLLNTAMNSVFDSNVCVNILPTCSRLNSLLSHTLSAKTGSTNTDNLIVGYNQDILLSIWTGYDNNQEISNNETAFGKTIWARSIENYLSSNHLNNWYKMPNNIIEIELNPVSGFYAGVNEYTKKLYFRKNNIPWYVEFIYKKDE